MDENKIFGLLEKIYVEVQEVKNEVQEIKNEVKEVKNEVKKINVKIDGKLIPTDKALLDGYKDNAEHITIVDDKIDRLQMDVNSISMKVSYNDSRIIEISKDLKKAK